VTFFSRDGVIDCDEFLAALNAPGSKDAQALFYWFCRDRKMKNAIGLKEFLYGLYELFQGDDERNQEALVLARKIFRLS
jgi:hypothetical protein